jgi:hypothetical protein
MSEEKPKYITDAHWHGECSSCPDCERILGTIASDMAKLAIEEEQERILKYLIITLSVYGGFNSTVRDVLINLAQQINPNHETVKLAVETAKEWDEKNA